MTVSDETMKKMGWQIVHVDKPLKEGQRPDLPAIEQLAIWDQEYGSNEIVSNFDKYRQRCGKKEVVIFVHGCCATFQTSLERAAKLASHMQMPIVVFDWDSPKGFTKYLANETTAEQSLDDFYAFLVNAEKSIQPGDTILLGHSMGARFLNDAMVRRSERARFNIPYQKYGELILSQPDIDARSYINHNGDIVGQAELTRIYFNTTDGRLDASATAHGDFERLGRPEKFLDTLCSVDGQEMIDITECAMGHEIPFWVVGDLTNHLDTAPGGLACKQVGKGHYVLQKITP